MTPVTRALLFANVAVFFLQATVQGITNLFAFVPYAILSRPWTILTYMFVHGGFGHIAFNMLALFFFGPRVEGQMGSRRFTILYFLSGLAGALASLVFSPAAAIIGASAGVFGVMMAFAHFWPHAPIMIWGIIPVPARMLVIGTTLLALFADRVGFQRGVAHFAHLGGYAGAYLYLVWLDRRSKSFRRQIEKVPKDVATRVERWDAIDVSRVHEVNRVEVNRLLDKISQSGVSSLTAEERLFLSNFVPASDRVSGPQ
jgi:membrane associated rhomboid family serine protease